MVRQNRLEQILSVEAKRQRAQRAEEQDVPSNPSTPGLPNNKASYSL
jgi:hypothetical protein